MSDVIIEAGVEVLNSNVDKVFSFGRRVYGSLEQKKKIREGYDRYIMKSRVHFSKIKSLWSNGTPIDFYDCYVPIGLRSGFSLDISEPDFINCIDVSYRLVISGTGGCGKSILMRHLFLSAIKSGKFAPVLVELRDLNDSVRTIEDHIMLIMRNRGFDIEGDFFKKAVEDGGFCFLFDGFDELLVSKREAVSDFINSLSQKYLGCPVIVSTRPDERFRTWDVFTELRVQPLSKVSAIELVEKISVESVVKDKFIKELKRSLFRKHKSFLSNPLLLSIMLITYHRNAEIPTKLSVFYEQAYEALFQKHDASKGAYSRKKATNLDIFDFSRVFSFFSLITFDKRIFSMSVSDCIDYIEQSRKMLGMEFDRECYLEDLLKATCLLVEDGLQVSYSHRSFQEFFVSKYILSEEYDVQLRLINRFWRPFSEDSIISLLYEQNPELVERALLLPRLEQMFAKINVVDSIDDAAVLNFLKLSYSLMKVERDSLSFHFGGGADKNDFSVLLASQASVLCGGFKNPCIDEYERIAKEIYKIAVPRGNKDVISIVVEGLTLDSEVFKVLLNSQTDYGKSYLENVHRIYTALVKKHERRVEDLFMLLAGE